ncbi:hypothetical protein CY34DRAFT_460600 [Suillus luteus UH-Slu-Lm8-n1]|uniref:Uncharacterized protein n=1 Tax=Suillus luteus UH-Slu-Lm8-n1 TaxID=930992 RepID=A0A0D0AT05_9AGAM|nr:hypothetical protein CY34DRAFT_460600 [Suillus luteus UH-Slu-Lm8-n1]
MVSHYLSTCRLKKKPGSLLKDQRAKRLASCFSSIDLYRRDGKTTEGAKIEYKIGSLAICSLSREAPVKPNSSFTDIWYPHVSHLPS